MSHVDDATLHELVDDELDPATRPQVEAHLATCGDCARRFAEATAMARQVVSLLTALDEGALPKLMVAPVGRRDVALPVPAVGAPARRRRMPALQRIAIAASVLLVAGVSYQVGKRGDGGASARLAERTASTDSVGVPAPPRQVETAIAAAAPVAAPSSTPAQDALRAKAQSVEATTVPQRRAAESVGARPSVPVPATGLSGQIDAADRAELRAAESRSVTSATVRADAALARRPSVQDSLVGVQLSPAPAGRSLRMPDVVAGNVAAAAPAAMPVARSAPTLPERELAGYATVEERSAPAMPAITRRRYVSASGTALVLTIVQGAAAAEPSATTPEYVVSSSNGRSRVRWQARGMTYELQGSLSPDSLMRLATQLK